MAFSAISFLLFVYFAVLRHITTHLQGIIKVNHIESLK